MTFKLGNASREKLVTCHPRLQEIIEEAISVTPYDFTVLEGHRSVELQQKAFRDGMSQIDGVSKMGNHNFTPSRAVDVAPWPIDWENLKRFHILAGIILGVAGSMNVTLRWGGDWDRDGDFTDQRLHDLPHFEVRL